MAWTCGNRNVVGPNGKFRVIRLISCRGAVGLYERYYEIEKRFIDAGRPWDEPDGSRFTWERYPPDAPLGYISHPFLWKAADFADHRLAGLQVGFGARHFVGDVRGSGVRIAPGLDRHRWARLPLGYIAPFVSRLPAVWIYSALRRRRVRKGRCSSCGYDLTANTSGICPECGTVLPPKMMR